MTTDSILLDRDAVHNVFEEWTTAEDSLDAQLNESLAALAAYQSHLDEWQQQLACERDELRQAREEFQRDRAIAEVDPISTSPEALTELNTVREKNAALSDSLVSRTEELRAMDERRSELAAELESARALQTELKSSLDEQKRILDEERAKWAAEAKSLRERLESRGDATEPVDHVTATPHQPAAGTPPDAPTAKRETAASSAVLGSIVEQFGKLRLQRANDRQGLKKTR